MAEQNPTSNEINTIVDRLGTLHLSTKELLEKKNVNDCVSQQIVNFSDNLNTFHGQLSTLITRSSKFTPSFISCVKEIHLLVEEIIELNKVASQYRIPINDNNEKNALLEHVSTEVPEAFMEETMLNKLDLYTTRLHELSIAIQNLKKELISPHR